MKNTKQEEQDFNYRDDPRHSLIDGHDSEELILTLIETAEQVSQITLNLLNRGYSFKDADFKQRGKPSTLIDELENRKKELLRIQ